MLSHHRLQAQTGFASSLARPLRLIRRLLRRWRRQARVRLIPVNQLSADGAEWVSSGTDPQFLLMPDREWRALAGWHWLEVEALSRAPLKAQLYFDLGEGFDPAWVVDFRLLGSGVQRIPLRIQKTCRGVRLDPCEAPGRFRLQVRGLLRLRQAPAVPAEPRGPAPSSWECGPGSLEPAHAVRRSDEAGFDWAAEGADPWFVLKDLPVELRPGWYRIEVRMHSDVGFGNAKLYVDYGQGYGEAHAVTLPFHERETVERLYRLPVTPREVRFDPLERPARFTVEQLRWTPVQPMRVRNAMLRRLCRHETGQRERSIALVWREIRARTPTTAGALELLCRRYDATFAAKGPHDRVSYAEWIARIEVPEFSDGQAIDRARASFTLQPVISVVMPVYNTAEVFLRRAIDSVLAQSYPHWELCIADDASPGQHVRRVLEEYARRDTRIKVMFRAENGHISAASNSGLALAGGEYVALLDHDDELAPHALHCVVRAINRQPAARILYSDEDKIDAEGARAEPHFKPEWNPDLFLSQNYVSHLGVYRRDLLERVGGFRAGVEGSQDQDLVLRCLAHVAPDSIVHIPNVLYHWRAAAGSTALASDEKRYAGDAGIKALEDFFAARGRNDVKIEAGLVPHTYRVRYPIPRPEPLVSLLIPTRDQAQLLEACVDSILGKTTYGNFEILILDNGSAEVATLQYFQRAQGDPRVRVLPYYQPFNFSAINNFGVGEARGVVVGLVNNDIKVISPGWLTEMVSHALRPEIGCVGAKLYYDDETIQHAGVIVGLGGVAGHSHKYFPRAASGYFHRLKIVQNLSAVTAACLVVRKAVYEEVGGLEENGLGIAFNDVDFCLKVRAAGYRNLWTPYAELYHYESKSRGLENTPDKVERFNREIEFMQAKWGDVLRRDPCYSPNLTLAREDFSLG